MRRLPVLALTLLISSGIPLNAADPIQVQIDRSVEKFRLGLSKFDARSRHLSNAIVDEFHRTLARDLKFSRLFEIVSQGPQVTNRSDVSQWITLGSQGVLGGDLTLLSRGRGQASGVLYELPSTKPLVKFRVRHDTWDTRYLAHLAADEVVSYFTGQKGVFTSNVVFVNDQTGRKELYISLYDGSALRRLTNDNSIVILPRLSPDGNKIIFTSYRSGNPDLYLIGTDGHGRRLVSAKAGLNVSPSWSPNNRELAVTLSKDGPPNIYLMDLSGKVLKRLTDGKGADTAPAFSPDGGQIAFTSDRAGAPHIYVVNLDGSGLRRLTTDGHCDSAAWSPDGKTLVYVKGKGGTRFDIYSIDVLTGVERRLTWSEGDNENPTWSPDSQSILFTSTRRGKTELYTMAADGTSQEPVGGVKGQSFTPHWSQ